MFRAQGYPSILLASALVLILVAVPVCAFQAAIPTGFCVLRNETAGEIMSKALGTDLLGCVITAKEASRGLGIMHWLIPEGVKAKKVSVDGKVIIDGLTKAGAEAVAEKTVDALNTAADSLKNEGTLTSVDLDCLVSQPPDLVASVLVKSSSPSVFNKNMKTVCPSASGVRRQVTRQIIIIPVLFVRLILGIIWLFIVILLPFPPFIVIFPLTVIQALWVLIVLGFTVIIL